MKVLGLDPTEETRSRLALGVGYEGNRAELTAMNIWLLSYVKEVVASVGGDLAVARNVLLKKISNQSIDATNRLTLTPDVYRSHPQHLLTADVQLPSKNIDISIVLDNAVKLRREKLNWRQSIVDIMKVLRLDSSREPRTRLALAVGYDGDVNDSWTMNIWLLSYVKDAIAAVGGDLTAAREVLLAKMS
ncbi:hypothetical protein F5887DRAFT_969184 [Amanita rubescens]|nr:hypothetical protein F5887DRAFT_969184 [Amanita rubescens]